MPTQNVNLPDHLSEFIRERVTSGRYQNASEVVRAGLRLLEQQEAEDAVRLETLQRIAKQSFDALDRGEAVTHTKESLHDFLDDLDARIRGHRPAK